MGSGFAIRLHAHFRNLKAVHTSIFIAVGRRVND